MCERILEAIYEDLRVTTSKLLRENQGIAINSIQWLEF